MATDAPLKYVVGFHFSPDRRGVILIRKLRPQARFSVVSNPEFLREGAAIDDFVARLVPADGEPVIVFPSEALIVDGEPRDRFVTGELLTHVVYTAQVVVSQQEITPEVLDAMRTAMVGEYDMLANFSFGGMPFEEVYKQMKLFADKVNGDPKSPIKIDFAGGPEVTPPAQLAAETAPSCREQRFLFRCSDPG